MLFCMEQAAFDGADRNVEPPRDLRLRQFLEVAEIKDLLVGIAEPIERFPHDRPRRNAVDAGRKRRLVKRFQRDLHALCLGAEIIVALVLCNAHEPRLQHLAVFQGVFAPIGRKQHFLQDVLRILRVVDAKADIPFQRAKMLPYAHFKAFHVLTSVPVS